MGDFFGGLRTGIQFPQVVMNEGPLPSAGGLPQPLHETPDARINYNSSLLGDLTPYAYGEPGYLSSQTAYLNIPHKIQKIVPEIYVPEARCPAKDLIDVSHPVDDGDLAFVLRLDRNSMFCTGLKSSAMKRAGLGTAIDPFINLCTLNYILSGMQLGVNNDSNNLWVELLCNLDRQRFGGGSGTGRDYEGSGKITINDIVHVVRHCIRPFGITRGSEKQGGQNEATLSPATWPVSFVASMTIDGKESNVLNIWHSHELHAGNDLVLRLKPMPVRPYTLNHYYKSVKRQSWETRHFSERTGGFVWQLVPDLFELELPSAEEVEQNRNAFRAWDKTKCALDRFEYWARVINGNAPYEPVYPNNIYGEYDVNEHPTWQELGYWHIGRAQIQTGKYGTEEYWHNDLANSLKTNHLDITFQPVWNALPYVIQRKEKLYSAVLNKKARIGKSSSSSESKKPAWTPSLRLEKIQAERAEPPKLAAPEQQQAPSLEEEPDWLGRLDFSDDVVLAGPAPPPVVEEPASSKPRKQPKKGARPVGGSLLKADGTSEPSLVGML